MTFAPGRFALVAAASFLIPSAVEGQQIPLQGINMVERVVAVVGDSMISMTELEESLLGMEARGWVRPVGAVELLEAKREVLEQLINTLLILQDAAKDSLLGVPEEELEDRVQQEIDGQVRGFGTLGAFQRALAEQSMTLALYRERTKNNIKDQLMQDRYFAKRGRSDRSIVVTEEEARAYFDENQDLIPERPPTITFVNIRVQPEPSESAKAEALARADSVGALLVDGEDFAELAERFSDGPSASDGGALGWIRQDGSSLEEFEEVAFAIPAGAVSNPVETSYGYHLILVQRIRGGERLVRHILFQPELTVADVELSDARAEVFGDRLRFGETMVGLGEEPDTIELDLDGIAQTSQGLAVGLQNAVEGEVIGPVGLNDPQARNVWILARMVANTPGGPGQFEDFQDMIVDRLKSEGLTESVIEELRDRAYIDIRLGGG